MAEDTLSARIYSTACKAKRAKCLDSAQPDSRDHEHFCYLCHVKGLTNGFTLKRDSVFDNNFIMLLTQRYRQAIKDMDSPDEIDCLVENIHKSYSNQIQDKIGAEWTRGSIRHHIKDLCLPSFAMRMCIYDTMELQRKLKSKVVYSESDGSETVDPVGVRSFVDMTKLVCESVKTYILAVDNMKRKRNPRSK